MLSSRYRWIRIVGTLFIGFCLTNMVQAQGTLMGQVLDSETQEPLIGVTLLFDQGGAVTNSLGKYILALPTGNHTIQVAYVGYTEQLYDLQIKKDQTIEENFLLVEGTTLLETVTVTSGKFAKELGEVTVSMEVLPNNFLEQVNATSADEALGRISGLTVADGQANVRGGSGWSFGAGSRVLLLIDDMPALQQDAGFPNWDDIPMENIDQIEVLKGAGSALYGSAAMNGIINIRTAYAKKEPFTQFSSHFRVYGTPKDAAKKWWDAAPFETSFRLAHRQKFNKFEFTSGAFYLKRSSYNLLSETDYGRLNFNGRYHFSDKLQVGANININSGERSSFFYWQATDCKCGSYESDSSNISLTTRLRYTIDPFVQYYDANNNRHKFNGRYYRVKNDSGNGQSNSSHSFYGEYQFQRQFTPTNTILTSGLVGQLAYSDSDLYSDTTFQLSNTGLYLQLEQKLWQRLQLSLGGRYEWNSLSAPDSLQLENETVAAGKRQEAQPVFRAGLNYKLGKATYIRSSWGQGYRYPTIAEAYISTLAGGLSIIPNPELEAERGTTFEIGIKQGFKIKQWNGFVDLAAFSSRYQNMMEFTLLTITGSLLNPIPVFQSRNVGDTQIDGLEFSFGTEGKLGPFDFNISGGYTLLDPTFKEFDLSGKAFGIVLPDDATPAQINAFSSSSKENVLKYRNKNSWTINAEVAFKPLSLGINYRSGSRMDAIDTGFLLLPVNILNWREDHDQGFKVLDVRLNCKLPKGFTIGFHIENANNFEYSLRPGLLEAPRSYIFKLTWKR